MILSVGAICEIGEKRKKKLIVLLFMFLLIAKQVCSAEESHRLHPVPAAVQPETETGEHGS